MKEVKVLQRFQCDFCKKRSVKHVIALHEKRCYRNPNRFCDACDNTGKVDSGHEGYLIDCDYCSKFNEKMSKEIDEYKKSIGNKYNECVEGCGTKVEGPLTQCSNCRIEL